MAVVARRLGMDTRDPELEQRLRRIEQVLAMKAAANEFSDTQSGSNQDIPKPEGLSSEYHITKWKVTWDPVDIPDVKKYELIVGTDSAFSTVLGNYTRTEPEFTYPGASADITYYVRIRAVNMDLEEGPYSDTLNVTTSGLITTDEIEENALTQLWEFNQTSGFKAVFTDATPSATEGITDEYGPLVVEVSSASALILPFATFDVYYQSIYQSPILINSTWDIYTVLDMPANYMRIRFDRAPTGTGIKTNLMDMYLDYWSTVPYSGEWKEAVALEWDTVPIKGTDVALTRISLPLLPDAPGAGTYDYTFTIDVASDVGQFMYVLPTSLKLRFLEYKNT